MQAVSPRSGAIAPNPAPSLRATASLTTLGHLRNAQFSCAWHSAIAAHGSATRAVVNVRRRWPSLSLARAWRQANMKRAGDASCFSVGVADLDALQGRARGQLTQPEIEPGQVFRQGISGGARGVLVGVQTVNEREPGPTTKGLAADIVMIRQPMVGQEGV